MNKITMIIVDIIETRAPENVGSVKSDGNFLYTSNYFNLFFNVFPNIIVYF